MHAVQNGVTTKRSGHMKLKVSVGRDSYCPDRSPPGVYLYIKSRCRYAASRKYHIMRMLFIRVYLSGIIAMGVVEDSKRAVVATTTTSRYHAK